MPHNQVGIELPYGTKQGIFPIGTGLLKAVERGSHLVWQVSIARGKLMPKDLQERNVDLVRAVRVGGVDGRCDVRGVIVEQVEDPVTFMIVGTDQLRVDGHIVDDQARRHHAFAHPKILGGVAGVKCGQIRLKLLAVARGVDNTIEIVVAKERRGGHCVDDPRVGRLERFQPQVVA